MRLLLVLALAAQCCWTRYVREPALCCGWLSSTDETTNSPSTVQFSVQAREQGEEEIRRIALAVSDPDSPRYGEYLSQSEIDRITAPAAGTVQAIRHWLDTAACVVTKVTKDRYFEVTCSAAQARTLLSTSLRWVVNAVTKETVVRASDFTIPEALDKEVQAVFGLHGFPLPRRKSPANRAGDLPPALRNATPATIAEVYKISGVKVSRSERNRQAVATFFASESGNQTDLTTFFQKYVPDAKPGDSFFSKTVNNTPLYEAGGEGNLDSQCIMSTAVGIKTEMWVFAKADSFCQNIKEWALEVLKDDNGPLVHSVSYGNQGNITHSCDPDEVEAVEADFVKIAAKGISNIWCSQDGGSGWTEPSPGEHFKPYLFPSWPAGSPWVTAVGSTQFETAEPRSIQVAARVFGSGGGFSPRFDRENAGWQNVSVKNYLRTVPQGRPHPPKGTYPPEGRGIPDVAVLGWGYPLFDGGVLQMDGGTSASTPVFAGMISLLNEARLQRGMKPLGYLNPWLYKHADDFTDITKGTNAIGAFTGKPLKYGWNCTEGWDAVTGLGTPRFDKLLAAATGESHAVLV